MKTSMKEENILPPIQRSRRQFDDKSNSMSLNTSNHKFKVIQTAVWSHNGKELLKKDQVTELDRRLDKQLNSEKSNLTQYLISMRRTHDEMIKKIKEKQKQTKKMREETNSMKRQIEVFNKQIQRGRKQMQGMQNNFQNIKSKQQTSVMSGKTLQHILDRMKKDEIVYHIKINQLEKKIKYLDSGMNEFNRKKFQLNQFEALSSITAKQVKNSYNECFLKRQKDMELYQSLIKKKKQFDEKSQQRQKITDQIQAIAASDLNDSNLMKWKKLLMVQLLLKKLLKSKVNKLENKYDSVKNAFHTIKIKTTIDDPNILANEYFKLEQTYNQLTKDIKALEDNQKTLLSQRQQSKLKLQKLNNQYNSIASSLEKQNQQQDIDMLKQIKQISQRNFQTKLIQQKMFSWVVQNSWKIECLKYKISSVSEKKKFIESYQKDKLSECFINFCKGLIGISEELNNTISEKQNIGYSQLQSLQAVTTRSSSMQNQQQNVSQKTYSDRGGMKKTFRI